MRRAIGNKKEKGIVFMLSAFQIINGTIRLSKRIVSFPLFHFARIVIIGRIVVIVRAFVRSPEINPQPSFGWDVIVLVAIPI